MRVLLQVAVISTGLVFLTACTNHMEKSIPKSAPKLNQPSPAGKKNASNNPLKVSFYTKKAPQKPYVIVGEESISKFNQGGIKRQEAHIRYAMSELAAAMGGDAVIDIKSDGKSITGTVVAFEHDVASQAVVTQAETSKQPS